MVLQFVHSDKTTPAPVKPSGAMPRLRLRIRPFWQWFLTGLPPHLESTPADMQAFRAHSHQDLRRSIYFLFVLLMSINVFYWFTDAWVFESRPDVIPVFTQWRSSLVLTGMITLLMQAIPKLSAYISGTLGGALICFSSAYHMALLGGPSTPWFHFLHPFMLIVLIAWATPLLRIAVTCLMAAAILVGYFGFHPHYLVDPLAFTGLGYFAYIIVLCYLLGLYTDNNRLRLFMARLDVERARDHLNTRVMEQGVILAGLLTRLDTLRDAERKTLAQELHDELGQLLTAQRLVLQSTRQRYRLNGASIEPNLVTLESLLDRFSSHFRSQLSSLRPPVLEGGDIRSAVQTLVNQWSTQAGIPCTLTLPPFPLGMDGEQAGVVYRFVQEALTNVAKHAIAQQVAISISVEHDHLRARVRDDGVGMTSSQPDHSHMGLLGIRERVEAIQGSLELHTSPGQGMTLTIDIPLTGMLPTSDTSNQRSRPT